MVYFPQAMRGLKGKGGKQVCAAAKSVRDGRVLRLLTSSGHVVFWRFALNSEMNFCRDELLQPSFLQTSLASFSDVYLRILSPFALGPDNNIPTLGSAGRALSASCVVQICVEPFTNNLAHFDSNATGPRTWGKLATQWVL